MATHILEMLLVKENIVHFGAALYLAGFLFRDQLVLRGLIAAGDLIYILYFFYAPETPLWGGIFWSTLFIVVNIAMAGLIMAERTTYGLNTEEEALFKQLQTLSPGQFRKLLRIARFERSAAETRLANEGESLDRLHYVVDGVVSISKSNGYCTAGSQYFVGEVAFLLNQPASATVTVSPGAGVFSFDHAALRVLLKRNGDLATAMSNAMNLNLASKIAATGMPYELPEPHVVLAA